MYPSPRWNVAVCPQGTHRSLVFTAGAIELRRKGSHVNRIRQTNL